MKLPNAVEILRASGSDFYGNAASSWATPTRFPTNAFLVQKGATQDGAQAVIVLALFAPDTDLRPSDRLQHGEIIYEVVGDIVTASSPSKAVLKTATLRRVNRG